MKETSVDIQGITEGMKAWNWDALETHLAMMNAATVVLATDSGLAHLAVLNQNPLRVIYDEPGKEAGHPKWPWVLPHMKAHAVASCEPILYGWNSPETVVSSVLSVLNAGRQT
jgi:ADP-heptose:LPS heptosyltransferase